MRKPILAIIAITVIVGGLTAVGLVVAALYYIPAGWYAISSPQPPEPGPSPDNTIADHGLYRNENNWIATNISREIAQQCWLAVHPGVALPALDVTATVEPKEGKVHVQISGWNAGGASVTADLTPVHAWDPAGYAPLARQLLGDRKAEDPTRLPNILDDLLTPTAKQLGTDDTTLSAALVDSPASPTLHEDGALLLLTMALRENAGVLSDTRRELSRAAAHLAIARALRGDAPPSMTGRIASAALTTLAGREVDALKELDAILAVNDPSTEVQVWQRVLRLTNKRDWRAEKPDKEWPLLLQIAWAQTLAVNLEDSLAAAYFDQLETDNQLPDWGRALLSNNPDVSVEIGHRYCASTFKLEFRDLNEFLAAENETPDKTAPMAKIFAGKIGDTVTAGGTGGNRVAIIGPGLYKDAALRHLFTAITRTHYWMANAWGVPEQDAEFLGKIRPLFKGVPHERYLEAMLRGPTYDSRPNGTGMKADLSYIPPGFAYFVTWPESVKDRVDGYFFWGVPFGAPCEMEARIKAVASNRVHNVFSKDEPPAADELLPLAPDSYTLASWTVANKFYTHTYLMREQVEPLLSPFFGYNTSALSYFRKLAPDVHGLDDAAMENLYRKESALDPDTYFQLGRFLRQHNRPNEAAEADRAGVKDAHNRVLVANAVQPLVEYDFAHGKLDEALEIAKDAADVYSARGIETYIWLLCKLDRYDEAKDWAQKEDERYDNNSLSAFYAAHQDHFPEEHARAMKEIYPDGVSEVMLNSFTGAPRDGLAFTSTTASFNASGLRTTDVIVALDSHPVHNGAGYTYIRALSDSPEMHFIVWREGHYQEINVTLPGRRFGNDFQDYKGN